MEAFDQAVEKYHASLLDFVKGNAEPTLQMFSQRDDVVLCNPFRPVRTRAGRSRGSR
jgi:hypothetical protein